MGTLNVPTSIAASESEQTVRYKFLANERFRSHYLKGVALRLSIAILLLLPARRLCAASVLTWGVCSHPGAGKLWNDPASQLALLESRGLKSYRFDFTLTDGRPNTDLERLVALANLHHITLHPILKVPFTWGDTTDHGRYPNTEAGLEMQGYNRVYPVVRQFAGYIQDWELQNELSLVTGFKSGGGLSVDDYATPLARQWAAVLRGMSKAISRVRVETGQPLRTVVDMVYVDFGFVPFLEAHGVMIDKLAYHYYYFLGTNPYRINAPQAIVDLFANLAKIGKPIIINEFNAAEIYAPKNGNPYDDGKALESLKKHIEYLLNQKEAQIEGIEYYELYDEPTKVTVEGNFGLMKDAANPKTQMLLAAAYACGHLSANEQAELVAKGLFTSATLASLLAKCTPDNY